MAKLKSVTIADHDRLYFMRWVLFLLVANDAAGLPEITRQRLHALLFTSFAASRFYGIEPLRQRARRTEQGPYYRNAHVALGGLVLGGMALVDDFVPYPKAQDLQFDGSFRATLLGLKVAKQLQETSTGRQLYRFLLDMCLGVAKNTPEMPQVELGSIDRLLSADLTYSRAMRRHSDLMELRESPSEETPTVVGLKKIDSVLSRQTALNRKDIVAAYQALLVNRSAKAA